MQKNLKLKMHKIPKICINNDLPDGILIGYDNLGTVVCCLEFHPNYNFYFGSENYRDLVCEWSVCRSHALRIATIISWRESNYFCIGNA